MIYLGYLLRQSQATRNGQNSDMTGRAISYFPGLSNRMEEGTWSNQE